MSSAKWRPFCLGLNVLMGPLGTNFNENSIQIEKKNSRQCISKYRLGNGGHFVQGDELNILHV